MMDIDVLDALNYEVQRLFQIGKYSEAYLESKRAVTLAEQLAFSDHPAVANSFNNLGLIYKTQGRYAEAEPFYKNALAIWERARDEVNVANGLNNLAELYRTQHCFAEAAPLFTRSLAIRENVFGPHDLRVAQSLNGLAGLYRVQARFTEAEALFKRSLAIRETALDRNHPDLAESFNNLAELYRAQNRCPEAEPLYKRSRSIWEKALGPNHVNVASSLNNLAGVYFAQGRYAEAEPLYTRSLAIREKALGPNHIIVASSLNNLAELYRAQHRYAEAELFYKDSLAIWERVPDAVKVADGLNNLAVLYDSQHRFSEAEPLFLRSLAIREKALDPNHPDIGQSLINLAGLYHAQRRYEEAESLFKRAEAMPSWEVVDIPILFATNRALEPARGRTTFGAQQKSNLEEISFGKGIVRAPKSEVLNRADRLAQALGQLNRAIGRQTSLGGLAVRRVDLDERGASLSAIARDRLSRAARFPGHAFIFVHGYNNSFEDAMRRAAMIAFDLDFDGATFLFTWPSDVPYPIARKRARSAVPFLVELLDRIAAQLPDVKLHMLAHSTGGEVALSALAELAERSKLARPYFGELILAHADVDPTRLRRVMPSLRNLGIGVTSYSSAMDWAMRISRGIRYMTRSRVGAAPVHINGIEAIDTTGLSGGPLALNHTVFVDHPLVFGDIARLISSGMRPPDKRTPHFFPVTTPEGKHWEYRTDTRS